MPLLHFSSNFKEISSELSWLSTRLILVNCLQNLKFQPHTTTNIAGSPEKNIYFSINNTFLVKAHQDLNFETKIVGIGEQLSKIYHFKDKNMKFYDFNFELLLSTFCSIIPS